MPISIAKTIANCRAAQAGWANVPLRERLAIVRKLRHLFVENVDRLCLTVTHDIGRPAHEVLATDVLPTADAFRFLERRSKRILCPKRIPGSVRPWWLLGECETIFRRPLGIVGIIGTWNYPILLNAVTLAQAFVAGNGVVWKPSELTPTFAEFLHELFLQAGFPAELFVRLPADRESGVLLVESDIDHVIFTGSANVGRKIAARLGERLIPCTLELSGCDSMFVLDDADPILAARAAWFGSTMNVGQTCLAVRRAFVHRSKYESFLEKLRSLNKDRRPEPLALLGQAMQAERLVQEALSAGATLLTGDSAHAADDPPRFSPTIVVDAKPSMTICQEASFAPLLAVLPFDNDAQLIAMNEACSYGLGASVFTRNRKRANALARKLRVGSVSINDVVVGTAHPAIGFGGVRHSGWGVTRGEEGLLALTAPQVVTRRIGTFRPHFDTHDPALWGAMSGLLEWIHGSHCRKRWRGFRRMIGGLLRFGKPAKPDAAAK
ncbi:MAG: aldehyde dehydrogenase family protein [Gemmataceae bacterium]|nr:aldehyde dehydrogenase family protein [Gemmataceae bacterium]